MSMLDVRLSERNVYLSYGMTAAAVGLAITMTGFAVGVFFKLDAQDKALTELKGMVTVGLDKNLREAREYTDGKVGDVKRALEYHFSQKH